MTVTKHRITLAHAARQNAATAYGQNAATPENVWYISSGDSSAFTTAILQPLLEDPAVYVNEQFKAYILSTDETTFIIFHYGLDEANDIPVANIGGMENTNIIAVRCSPIPSTNPPSKIYDVDVCYAQPLGLAFVHVDLSDVSVAQKSEWVMDPHMFMLLLNTGNPTVLLSTLTTSDSFGQDQPTQIEAKVVYSLGSKFRFHYEYPATIDPSAPQCIKFAGPAQLYNYPPPPGGQALLQITVDEAWTLPWQDPNGGGSGQPVVYAQEPVIVK